jgi:epoxyqueuosine reductase
MSIEGILKAEAQRLGFAALGIARAEASQTLAFFQTWLEGHNAADMDWLQRHMELRADPRVLAPGIRSIIMTAARYPVHPAPGEGFSYYARGRDYHDVLRRNLETLAAWLAREAGAKIARICVDSTPLLEREWALRAGIGWRGRQGQVIHPQHGACIFLGALLTDAVLKQSTPMPAQCGTCRKCVDACPSGAINEQGCVDARKCLSYLTIEHKGDIPAPLQPAMGKTLFGCDRCTAVCPFNPPNNNDIMQAFQPGPMPDAAECLAMDAKTFKTRFAGTAVLRSGLARLQRNARIAMQS